MGDERIMHSVYAVTLPDLVRSLQIAWSERSVCKNLRGNFPAAGCCNCNPAHWLCQPPHGRHAGCIQFLAEFRTIPWHSRHRLGLRRWQESVSKMTSNIHVAPPSTDSFNSMIRDGGGVSLVVANLTTIGGPAPAQLAPHRGTNSNWRPRYEFDEFRAAMSQWAAERI
jgi:hypothetical protein